MALMSPRGWDEWIAEYGQSHQHPANRFCHTIGIPMIALSLIVLVAALVVPAAALGGAGAVRGRLDLPVRRPRLRGQAARVPEGLALPVRGAALVVQETKGLA